VCLLRGTFYVLRSAHTVYLCFLRGSENKQRLFHCAALILETVKLRLLGRQVHSEAVNVSKEFVVA